MLIIIYNVGGLKEETQNVAKCTACIPNYAEWIEGKS